MAVGFRFPQPATEFSVARRGLSESGLSKSDQTDALEEGNNQSGTRSASRNFERAQNERPYPLGATLPDVSASGLSMSGRSERAALSKRSNYVRREYVQR